VEHVGELLRAIVKKGEFLPEDKSLLEYSMNRKRLDTVVEEIITTKHGLLGTGDYEIETLIYEKLARRTDCTLMHLLRLYFEGELSYFNESAPIIWRDKNCLIKQFVERSTLRQYKKAAMYVYGFEDDGARHTASDLLTDFPHPGLPKREKESLKIIGNNYQEFASKEMVTLIDAIITIRNTRRERGGGYRPLSLAYFIGGPR